MKLEREQYVSHEYVIQSLFAGEDEISELQK